MKNSDPKYVMEYVWLIKKIGPIWTVSDWAGTNERTIDKRDLDDAIADFDRGYEVFRFIGSGKLAQHMRIYYEEVPA